MAVQVLNPPAQTDLTFIIDSSGSMCTLREDTIGGFNTLIEDQRTVEGGCNVSLVCFDSGSPTVVLEAVPLADVRKLTHDDYSPSGGTALYDAVGDTLTFLKERLGKAEKPPTNTTVVIVTDGEENSSREYTRETITTLVKSMEAEGVTFIFLGANIDAFQGGQGIGVGAASSYAFSANAKGVAGAYSAVSARMKGTRSGNMEAFSAQMTRGLTEASEDGTGTEGYGSAAVAAAVAEDLMDSDRLGIRE